MITFEEFSMTQAAFQAYINHTGENTLNTQTFWRKPFSVEAVQVTEENMQKIADWTKGEIRHRKAIAERNETGDVPYIKITTAFPLSERQRRAYVGDWVLMHDNNSFKIFKDSAFQKCFESYKDVEGDGEEITQDELEFEVKNDVADAPYLVN